MSTGIKTVIYPVQLLGAEPSSDLPYYVGFAVGDQEIGLDPNGHKHGTTPYWHVAAIDDSVDRLVKPAPRCSRQPKTSAAAGSSPY